MRNRKSSRLIKECRVGAPIDRRRQNGGDISEYASVVVRLSGQELPRNGQFLVIPVAQFGCN